MIIVLEGPDGAGKTTLAKSLGYWARGRVAYIHATRPEDQWPYATDIIKRALANERAGTHTIIDRLWISDNVYSFIDPSSGRCGIHVRRQESILHRYGAFYVMCCPEPEPLVEEYLKLCDVRPELYGKKAGKMTLVADLYHKLWFGGEPYHPAGDHPEQYTTQLTARFPFKDRPLTMLYDRFRVNDQQRWARSTLDYVYHAVRPFKLANVAQGFLGHDALNLTGSLVTCRALLVGERPGQSGADPLWPFYSMRGSSAHLTRCLHVAGVPEHHVAMVNAYSHQTLSHRPLQAALDWLNAHRPEVRVIALGRVASDVLDRLDQDHTLMPHPQWARRFKARDINYYAKLLELTINGTNPRVGEPARSAGAPVEAGAER